MVDVFKSIAAFIYYWKKILKNSILVINWQFARLSVISKNQLQHFNLAICIIKISRNSDLTYFWKFALYYQNVQFLLFHFWRSPVKFLWLSSFFINHFLLLLTACFSKRNWNSCNPQVESDSTKETCYCSKVL